MFSLARFSLALWRSTCNCAMRWRALETSSSIFAAESARSSSFASSPSLCSSTFAIATSFSCKLLVHQSFFLTSSACCCCNIATMSSIAFLTRAKESSSTAVANMESRGSWARTADCRSAAAAFWRLSRPRRDTPEETWMSEYVLLNVFRASSSMRMAMVSDTALISSALAFERAAKSASAVAQVFFKLAKNTWCSSRAATSCARSSLACAKSLLTVASSSSFFSAIFSPPAISSDFAARSSAKEAARELSSFCASDKSLSISSFNCFKMPTISPLLAAYEG
mmetsp:Transcript_68483/g.190994  ORF Transcript_68483/g.190994 Transcript_68483/m.190994 type:complete len:282 (+) Transcript_68483:226-1071(+)